ncbi:transposase [Microcystis aeruginosa NIES-843]|uniref:Transposase n=1 Tax=Microcystis aeruginosa (strain NIES-843 / IAM M-2473) TaxID=449447 RepID=B0JNI6_MICAN|nr:transposase [Microcystis aeruginosa NIES-843]
MKPLYRKTLLRFLPIVFNLERANQLSLLPDKDLADLCPLIEPYQVTKNQIISYFERRTTNGLVEGINNKLKLIKRSGTNSTARNLT